MSAFHAQILASDTLFFDGDCEFMVVPCTDGAMGILSHHSNMIAAVVPGELRVQAVGGAPSVLTRRTIIDRSARGASLFVKPPAGQDTGADFPGA